MAQIRSRTTTPLNVLAPPVCDHCQQSTRFVGLETDPNDPNADLCTYQCIACQHLQVASFPRVNGHGP